MIDVMNKYKRLSPAWYKCQLLIGQWPVHTKPMHPACSYLTSQGSLCCYLKVICIQHREERTRFFSENNEKCRHKYRKNNNAENYFEIFNIPPILMAMFTVCNICWFALQTWNFVFDVISNLCLHRSGQVAWIKTFWNHSALLLFWILNLLYHTYQIMYDTFFHQYNS